jgi:hypothetical protein
MCYPSLLVAYFSPETMLPLTSLIATIAGFALLIRRSSFRFVAHHIRTALGKRRRLVRTNRPHFRVPESDLTRSSSRSPR